ncbi:MAG: hypothetical protein AAB632_03565 [Patescibacteria group bacterium]
MKYKLRGDVLRGMIKKSHGNCSNPRLYQLSNWALRELAEKNPIEANAVHEAIKTAGIAMNLEKAMFQDRPHDRYVQPRICDLVDLVLALGQEDAQLCVRKLRRMAHALKEHVNRRGVQAWATDIGTSDLSNFSYAFNTLLRGAATAVHEGEVDDLLVHMKKENLRFFLEKTTSSEFVGALYGQSNEYYDEPCGGCVRKIEGAYV